MCVGLFFFFPAGQGRDIPVGVPTVLPPPYIGHGPKGGSICNGSPLEYAKIHQHTSLDVFFAYSNGLPSEYCHHYMDSLRPSPVGQNSGLLWGV